MCTCPVCPSRLLDHLIGQEEQGGGHCDPQRLGGLEVNDQLERRRLLNGKIARLPRTVREQLNRRLDDGEAAGPLLTWLNGLPETQSVLAEGFGGRALQERTSFVVHRTA